MKVLVIAPHMDDETLGMGATIAEAFRRKGHEVLFIINKNDRVIDLISQDGFDYSISESLDEITQCVEGRQNDVSILIQLNTPEEEALIFKNNSGMLVTIDDTGPSAKMADMRFNVLYPMEDSYTGFEYVTLSSVFQKKHTNNRVIKETVDNILVLQGGSDTYGFIPWHISLKEGSTYHINSDIMIKSAFDDVNGKRLSSFFISQTMKSIPRSPYFSLAF